MVRRKSPKEFWSRQYRGPGWTLAAKNLLNRSLTSYYHHELRRLLARHVRFKPGQRLIEVGCAPGGYLVLLHRWFGVRVEGIDYSREGCAQTRATLKQAGIDGEIHHADFFDKRWLHKHAGRYDHVFSKGFIEHFDDVETVIDHHLRLLRPGGHLICIIPNLQGVNKALTTKKVLDIHNLAIMSPQAMRTLFKGKGRILFCDYTGGPFNLGAFCYENRLLETARRALYAAQRLTCDQALKLIATTGARPRWAASSPSIMLICRRGRSAKRPGA